MKKPEILFYNIFLVCLLFTSSLVFRYYLTAKISADRGGYLSARESALFLYYGQKLISEDNGKNNDGKAIYNYGKRVDENKVFSLFAVRALAKTFIVLKKWTGESSFEDFTAAAGRIFYSFVPVILYLIILRLTGSRTSSFLGAAFSSFSLMAVERTTGADFTEEIYAMPFILASLYFIILFLTSREPSGHDKAFSVFAGISAGAALLLWDMTRMYILTSAAALLFLYFFIRKKEAAFLVYALLIIPLLMSFADPYQRYHLYAVFTANAFIPALAGAQLLIRGESKGKAGWRLGVFLLILFACILFFIPYNKAYSHFIELFYNKLIYLNIKPIDSAKLPYEARFLWTPALHSLSVKSFIEYYLGLVVLAVPGCVSAAKSIRREAAFYVWIVSGVYFIFGILFHRFIVFNAFLISLWIGITIFRVVRNQRLWLKFASFILVFLVFYSEARKIHSDSFAARYTDNFPYKEIRSLTKWIGLYTPEDSVFLSNFTATPDILYYGRRSIVTQPKYEDAESRKIIKDYISSLFAEGEEAFYGFCLNNNVDFYVFPKGTFNDRSLYSYWYMSGNTGEENALQRTAAFRFERDKRRLQHFGICYENRKYIVYRVITDKSEKISMQLYRQGLAALQKDKYSIEGLKKVYASYLYNPQNIYSLGILTVKERMLKGSYILPSCKIQ